jgi:glutamine cyclotransferase
MKHSRAEVLREYGPFPRIDKVAGVTFDGRSVWFASGDKLNALDPESGEIVGAVDVAHLYQIAGSLIRKIDPRTGAVLGVIPAPSEDGNAGLAWGEGSLWVGQYRGRKIFQIDPGTGAVLRVIETERFVTGVTWVDGELWHATWQDEASDIRRIDAETGEALDCLQMPEGMGVSGLESNGGDRFFCGGGSSGKVRSVRRPR